MANPLELVLRYFTIFFVGLAVVGRVLLLLWWIYLPIFLFALVWDLRLKYLREKYVKKTEWVLLEIIPPREVRQTPQSMEQFFSALHASQSGPNAKERNINGKTQNWYSMEMISIAGEIHFFIRTAAFFRNMVEAQLYGQYPNAEIREAPDYINTIPNDFLDKKYDLWGTEFVFTKEDAYPIRTYPGFSRKDILVMSEEQIIDPISTLLEVMGKLRENEHIWIQTLIRPVDDAWKKEGEKLRDKILKRAVEKKPDGIIKTETVELTKEQRSQLYFLITGKPWSEAAKEEREVNQLSLMTKNELEIIKAIEDDIAKFGYETIIRFIYVAPTDVFSKVNVASTIGAFKQFGSQNLNGFKPNKVVTPGIDYKIQLKGPRNTYRKKKILANYKKRHFVLQSKLIKYLKPFFYERLPILNKFFIKHKPVVLNSEELATIYHFPSISVQAPLVPKIEAKKGEPPIGLPME